MYKRDGTPDFYLVKGITDFRCGINRLSEIIRDKQTVNVFDNAAFIFTCKKRKIKLKSSIWEGWILAYCISSRTRKIQAVKRKRRPRIDNKRAINLVAKWVRN